MSYKRKRRLYGRPQVITTRGAFPGLLEGGPAANYTRMESETDWWVGRSDCTNIQTVYTNMYMSNSTAETPGPNSYTLESALRIPPSDGLPSIPFHFNNGVLNPVVPAGTPYFISDPLGVNVARNTRLRVRSGAIVASGDKVPGAMRIKSSTEKMASSTAGVSQVYNSSVFATPGGGAVSTTYGGFMPVCLLGIAQTYMPAVGIIGDSIAVGASDGNDGNGNYGFIERGLWNVYPDGSPVPYVNLSRGGDGLFYGGNSNSPNRLALLPYLSDVIIELGVNDFAGRTLQQMKDDFTVYATKARQAGCRVWATSITPKTDAGNTVVFSSDFTPVTGDRDLYNAWLISQVGILIDGYINVNSVLESVVSPGLWANSAFTSDGLHPITLGNTTAEAVIRLWAQTYLI